MFRITYIAAISGFCGRVEGCWAALWKMLHGADGQAFFCLHEHWLSAPALLSLPGLWGVRKLDRPIVDGLGVQLTLCWVLLGVVGVVAGGDDELAALPAPSDQ